MTRRVEPWPPPPAPRNPIQPAAFNHLFYRDAQFCESPCEVLLPIDLQIQRTVAYGAAFDLLGHGAEEDDWVYGFVSLVEGYHRGLKSGGMFVVSSGDGRPDPTPSMVPR